MSTGSGNLQRALLNPLAGPEQVDDTPSQQDGMSAQMEADLRAFGALLIQQAGIHLNAPQVVMTTASILFQRFYFVSSLKNFGIKDVAAAALFLSSKLEEHPIRIRELINCFDHSLQLVRWHAKGGEGTFDYRPMDYFAKEFYDWRDDIVIAESQILKRLGFNTIAHNPYGSMVNYLQVLELASHDSVPQTAWSVINDCLLTPILALYPPHYVAVSSIYLACLLHGVALPTKPRPWWILFDVEEEEEIHDVLSELLLLYQRWTGRTDWLRNKSLLSSRTIWQRAAEFKLPLTKDAVRKMLA